MSVSGDRGWSRSRFEEDRWNFAGLEQASVFEGEVGWGVVAYDDDDCRTDGRVHREGFYGGQHFGVVGHLCADFAVLGDGAIVMGCAGRVDGKVSVEGHPVEELRRTVGGAHGGEAAVQHGGNGGIADSVEGSVAHGFALHVGQEDGLLKADQGVPVGAVEHGSAVAVEGDGLIAERVELLRKAWGAAR